jgi:hypothetical protein
MSLWRRQFDTSPRPYAGGDIRRLIASVVFGFPMLMVRQRRWRQAQRVDAALLQEHRDVLDGAILGLLLSLFLLFRAHADSALEPLPDGHDRGEDAVPLFLQSTVLVVLVCADGGLVNQVLHDAVELGALYAVLVFQRLVELADELQRQVPAYLPPRTA